MTTSFSDAFQMDAIEIAGNALLFMLVFGMSATVDMQALKAQLQNKSAILTGAFLQFITLPLLGFLVVKVLKINEAMGITLLVLTSSPGGSYSNWWCSIFNADLALSVTMTAISTLLSVIMLPLNLLVYAKLAYEEDVISRIDWVSLFTALVVVILAISVGLYVSATTHSFRINLLANKMGNLAGIGLVVFSIFMSNGSEENAGLFNRSLKFYVGVSAPCIFGLIVANVLTYLIRLKEPERVTVSIECCYQNVGIATSVALTMFEGDQLAEAMGVPLFYGAVQAIVLSIYCVLAWKLGWTKAPKEDSLWHTLVTSYEVLLIEEKALREIEVSISEDESVGGEEESVNGDTIFHYFRFDDVPQRKKTSKAPSGETLTHPGDRVVIPRRSEVREDERPAEYVNAMIASRQACSERSIL